MSFEQTMVQCASPAICGIKPASLFLLQEKFFAEASEKIRSWNKNLSALKRKIQRINCLNGRVLLFVYDEELLSLALGDSLVQKYLRSKDYPVSRGSGAVLNELFFRLANGSEFPHEVGVFLGYPLEDVLGYEFNSGANCRYCDCWQVYSSDIEKAKCTMTAYRDCAALCRQFLEDGVKIEELSYKYNYILGGIK